MHSQPIFSVLIPTHNHGKLIEFAIRSVLRQSLENFELIVIGDAINEEGRDCVSGFLKADSRVRFFDLPKGPRLGEEHRHLILLQEAKGELVCYLCDDDMLFPKHLELMVPLLEKYNFVHPLSNFINLAGEYGVAEGYLGLDKVKQRLIDSDQYNFIGLSGTSHTMELYKTLPYGWRTTPPGIASDHYMWTQILSSPNCKPFSSSRPSTLHFPDSPRKTWTLKERWDELERWEKLMLEPDGEMKIASMALAYLVQARTELAERLRQD